MINMYVWVTNHKGFQDILCWLFEAKAFSKYHPWVLYNKMFHGFKKFTTVSKSKGLPASVTFKQLLIVITKL